VEAGPEACLDLGAEAPLRATCKVVEVRGLLPLEPAQESPQRLPGGSAADVPQGDVDSRPGEVARTRTELPEAVREHVAAHRLPVPRIASDDEGRHGSERSFDRRRVSTATRFAPADVTLVRRQSDEHVADPVSRDLRADLAMPVGNADRNCLEC